MKWTISMMAALALAACSEDGSSNGCPDQAPTELVGEPPPWSGFALALDQSHVYFTWGDDFSTGGWVKRVPKQGGATEDVSPGNTLRGPAEVALDETHVYWTDVVGGSISRTPKAGGPDQLVWDGNVMIQSSVLVLEGDHIFVLERDIAASKTRLLRVPKEGGAAAELVTLSGGGFALAADAQHVYYADFVDLPGGAADIVWRVPRMGGAPEKVGETLCSTMQLHGDHVYCLTAALTRLPKAGGAAQTLFHQQFGIVEMVVHDSGIYLVDQGSDNASDGSIKRVPLAGGEAQQLACGQHQPNRVAVDATGVYWINMGKVLPESFGGAVRKVPLPAP